MSITVTLTFSIKPERADEFKALMESLLPDTRAYDGCLRVDVYQDQDNPGNIILSRIGPPNSISRSIRPGETNQE